LDASGVYNTLSEEIQSEYTTILEALSSSPPNFPSIAQNFASGVPDAVTDTVFASNGTFPFGSNAGTTQNAANGSQTRSIKGVDSYILQEYYTITTTEGIQTTVQEYIQTYNVAPPPNTNNINGYPPYNPDVAPGTVTLGSLVTGSLWNSSSTQAYNTFIGSITRDTILDWIIPVSPSSSTG
jgi:hypothetical protein